MHACVVPAALIDRAACFLPSLLLAAFDDWKAEVLSVLTPTVDASVSARGVETAGVGAGAGAGAGGGADAGAGAGKGSGSRRPRFVVRRVCGRVCVRVSAMHESVRLDASLPHACRACARRVCSDAKEWLPKSEHRRMKRAEREAKEAAVRAAERRAVKSRESGSSTPVPASAEEKVCALTFAWRVLLFPPAQQWMSVAVLCPWCM